MVEPAPRIVLPATSVTAGASPDDGAPLPKRMACTFGHWAIVLLRRLRGGRFIHASHPYLIDDDTLMCCPPGFADIMLEPGFYVRHLSLEERPGDELWRAFAVPLIRRLEPAEADYWDARLARAERQVADGTFGDDDVRELKGAFKESLIEMPAAAKRIAMDVFTVLHEELASVRSLDVLASRFGYTRNHISDVMRDATGASLGRWVNGMRMARAREVLAVTDLAIADVGALVGIDDPAYFSRCFRRYHGVSPQHWRIAYRPDDERHRAIVVREEPPPEVIAAVA